MCENSLEDQLCSFEVLGGQRLDQDVRHFRLQLLALSYNLGTFLRRLAEILAELMVRSVEIEPHIVLLWRP